MSFFIPVVNLLWMNDTLDCRPRIPKTFLWFDLGEDMENPAYYRAKYAAIIQSLRIEPEVFLQLAMTQRKNVEVGVDHRIGPFETRDAAQMVKAIYQTSSSEGHGIHSREVVFRTHKGRLIQPPLAIVTRIYGAVEEE